MTPKPLALDHFTVQRTMHTSIPQWPQIVAWQRDRLVSVMPLDRDRASVVLTDKGREAVGSDAA